MAGMCPFSKLGGGFVGLDFSCIASLGSLAVVAFIEESATPGSKYVKGSRLESSVMSLFQRAPTSVDP